MSKKMCRNHVKADRLQDYVNMWQHRTDHIEKANYLEPQRNFISQVDYRVDQRTVLIRAEKFIRPVRPE